MKRIYSFLLMLAGAGIAFASPHQVTILIEGVDTEGGPLYVAVADSEQTYGKKTPYLAFVLEPGAETVRVSKELPTGDYVISVYQDLNRNGKLDTKLFGIPNEPVGISNYGGKGIPGGFNSLKLRVDGERSIPVTLVRI